MKHLLITVLALMAIALAAQAQTKYADPGKETDKTCWEWGDYVIAADGAVTYSDDQASISLKNKVTGKYVIPVISKSLAKRISNGNAYEGIIHGITYLKKDQDSWHGKGRIFFFDSSKRNTPPEMDGLLYLNGRITYKYKHIRGTGFNNLYGLYKIENDQLQQVAELPEGSFVFYDDIPVFGITSMQRCTTKVKTPWGVQENVHNYPVTDLYAYDGRQLLKDVLNITVSGNGDFLWVLDKEAVGSIEEHFASGRKNYSEYSYKALDFNLNPVPRFAGHSFLGPRKLTKGTATKHLIIADKGDYYGVIDLDGNDVIPALYLDPVVVDEVLKEYVNISYSMWYEGKAEYIKTHKDEFEKQDHFEARQADPALQEAFVQDKLADAKVTYLQEMLRKGVKITLGKYDAERECFPVFFSPAGWNAFSVAIPLDQAPALKEAFESIKEEALAGATYTVRNDAIGISSITFTLPDGKTISCEM
ncbi:MAG: hypothetical protein J6X77_01360 [Bacteroidales bacterium]|nr:hypothetical protein [Bacteroidales bacterium]